MEPRGIMSPGWLVPLTSCHVFGAHPCVSMDRCSAPWYGTLVSHEEPLRGVGRRHDFPMLPSPPTPSLKTLGGGKIMSPLRTEVLASSADAVERYVARSHVAAFPWKRIHGLPCTPRGHTDLMLPHWSCVLDRVAPPPSLRATASSSS